jgi:hypothetical protein
MVGPLFGPIFETAILGECSWTGDALCAVSPTMIYSESAFFKVVRKELSIFKTRPLRDLHRFIL